MSVTPQLLKAAHLACRKGYAERTLDREFAFHGQVVRFLTRVSDDGTVAKSLRADALYRLAMLADLSNRPTADFPAQATQRSILEQVGKRFPDSQQAIWVRFWQLNSRITNLPVEQRESETLKLVDQLPGEPFSADQLRSLAFDITANTKSDDNVAKLTHVIDILLRHADQYPKFIRIPSSTASGYQPPIVIWMAGLNLFPAGTDVKTLEDRAVRYVSHEPNGSSGIVTELARANVEDVKSFAGWFDR